MIKFALTICPSGQEAFEKWWSQVFQCTVERAKLGNQAAVFLPIQEQYNQNILHIQHQDNKRARKGL